VSERDETMRRWRQGEERLYPVVTVRPDLYERCTRLVRSLADQHGSVPDLDALLITYTAGDTAADLARAGIDSEDLPPEIEQDLVRDAAYNMRARQLAAREPVERASRQIRKAQAAGERTVTIWNEGRSEEWPPYRSVEMEVATGRAVAVSTEMNPETMAPLYVLEGLQLDPETGEGSADPSLAPRREFTDLDEWRSAAAELRRTLLSQS
jgi:hypothetical protein